ALQNDKNGLSSDIIRLGRHKPIGKAVANKVRLVAFRDEDQLMSLAESGELLQWNVAQPKAAPVLVHQFASTAIYQARIRPDLRWIGALSKVGAGTVELFALMSRQPLAIPLKGGERPLALAFDRRGERLAVGTWVLPQQANADPERGTGAQIA